MSACVCGGGGGGGSTRGRGGKQDREHVEGGEGELFRTIGPHLLFGWGGSENINGSGFIR